MVLPKSNSSSTGANHSQSAPCLTESDWETSALLKRSIAFDESNAFYEEGTAWECETKKRKLLSAGDANAANGRLSRTSCSSIGGSNATAVGYWCPMSEHRVHISPLSGLDLIHFSYADSDTSSPTRSPSPSPRGSKTMVFEKTGTSTPSRCSTPSSGVWSSRTLLAKSGESSHSDGIKQQCDVPDDRRAASSAEFAVLASGISESIDVGMDGSNASTEGFNCGSGAVSNLLIPRSAMLASKVVTSVRPASCDRPVNGNTNGSAITNSNCHNSPDGSMSFNVIDRNGHEFASASTANGYMPAIFDSEKASTSKIPVVEALKPSTSETDLSDKQHGISPKMHTNKPSEPNTCLVCSVVCSRHAQYRGSKTMVFEKTGTSTPSRCSTPSSGVWSSRTLLAKSGESSHSDGIKQQCDVPDDRRAASSAEFAVLASGISESIDVGMDGSNASTEGFNCGSGAVSNLLIPRSAMLASKVVTSVRPASCDRPVNGNTNGSAITNSNCHNSPDGSMSFNVIDRNGHEFASASTANGYMPAIFDSEKASTSKIPVVEALKPSTSETDLSDKQHGISPKDVITNSSLKMTRKRVLSERGKAEASYPVIDRKTLFSSWRGSRLLQACYRNAGVGLLNYSNDCFLNAVLQMMVHTAPLARYVAELHSCSNCSHNCFVCAMGEHVRKALTSPGPFRANWIQPYLKKIFPTHMPGYQEDAHELLTLILDALDPTPPASAKQNAPSASTSNQFREQCSSTPMEQMFGGALRNEIRCFGCGENYINYERIRELNLGLRIHKRESIIGLNDLLADYFSNETLSSFDCKKCKQKTQAQRVTYVIRAPRVLVIQLKRFNAFGCKIRLPVSVEMNVKLDRFMYQPGVRTSYSLCGLIEHQGEGIDRGHYIAFVRGFDGKGWHCFDDELCQRVSVEEVCKRQGYVMMYTRSEQLFKSSPSFTKAMDAQQRCSNKHKISSESKTPLVTAARWRSAPTSAVGRKTAS
ncbi:Ubiquitin carboxyl-terminal hydrolase 36 [Toxocara canis]|uniref:Ubiquitin carboxyl-terminal hydrolase 36 n=1 Tax=Toxocara canis TaxID=6265 RepID=A0A0B2VZ23_TOXCA|nr:Ubiquitin carboxyl-terminal hydrolase 36 [Toxocara canis]